MTNTADMIQIVRAAIKANGFKALVHRLRGYNGAFKVVVPTFETRFTPEQIRLFCTIVKDAGFTFVRGLEIDVEREAAKEGDGMQWEFYES